MMTMFDIETSGNIIMSNEEAYLDEEAYPGSPHRKPRERKFYIMSFDYNRAGRLGFSLGDESVIPYGQFDFLNFRKPPCFIFDRKRGRLPTDLEQYRNFWLVSDRTKTVFQAVDTGAFAFCECMVKLPDGDYDGPRYWLCNVTRILGALDEAQSRA
jgi:Protein of unknown function (DUF1629)